METPWPAACLTFWWRRNRRVTEGAVKLGNDAELRFSDLGGKVLVVCWCGCLGGSGWSSQWDQISCWWCLAFLEAGARLKSELLRCWGVT